MLAKADLGRWTLSPAMELRSLNLNRLTSDFQRWTLNLKRQAINQIS